VGHETPVFAPKGCQELDYELELAAIIGKDGENINEEHAWEYIAGFTILNDFSARDLQRRKWPWAWDRPRARFRHPQPGPIW